MQDTLLLRMRQAGWFDLLVFFLVLAISWSGWVAGLIQYNVQMSRWRRINGV